MYRYRWPLCGLLLLLTACGASAPLPEDRFYQLDLAVNSKLGATPAVFGGLIIDRVDADPLRSGRAMLYSDSKKPLELKRYHYEFWVDQPPELVHRALLEYFRATGLADRVLDPMAGGDARYRLSTRLQRFEQLRDSVSDNTDVEVELEATLIENASRTVLWTQRYRQRQSVSEPGMHATAGAMAAALGTVLDDLGRDLMALELHR